MTDAVVVKRNAEMRQALAVAMELLDRLANDDACEYDHDDCCQVHGLQKRPCPHPLARLVVAARRDVEQEEA